jgi:signal recognition particle receptor subunit beta
MSLVNKLAAVSIAIAAVAAPFATPALAAVQDKSNTASPQSMAMAQAGPTSAVRPTTTSQSTAAGGGASLMAKAPNRLK